MTGKTPTIFWRQFLITAVLILLTFLLLGASVGAFLYSYQAGQARTALENYARAVSALSSAYSTTGELAENWNYQMSLTFAANATGSDAVVCNEDGTVLVCSCSSVYCQHLGCRLDETLLDDARKDGHAARMTTLTGLYPEARFVYCQPLRSSDSGEDLGLLVVSAPRSDRVNFGHQLLLILIYAAPPCLLAALAVSSVAAERQTRELERMAEAARCFAQGDFSVRLEPRRTSWELSELVRAMNSMADALQQAETRRSEFISSVSHELKTPMTIIAGFVDGILDGTIPREKQSHYLENISQEVHRLDRLVRSMLEVSRLQEARAETPLRDRFDAVELVSRVLLSYEQRINAKHLDVDVEFPELEVPVLANSDSITRVVSNLIDNAVKFCDPDTQLGIGVYTMQDKAYIYVRDQGPTIPPEELSQIFDRFHKTDKSRSEDRDGVGLGLYLVRSILQSHGEEITVTSEDGVTEFTFTLPLARQR